MIQSLFTIVENENLATGIWRMRLQGDTSAITAPGQFVNLKLEGFFLRRPISVNDVEGDILTLIYKPLGEGTRQMTTFAPGKVLDILTGLGNGFDPALSGEKPVLVGGGVGIPPLFNLCKKLIAKGAKPVVVLGFNTANEIFYQREFEALGVPFLLATMDGSAGVKGLVTDALKELIEAGNQYDEIFAIGPMIMMKFVCKTTEPYGVPTTVSMSPIMIDGTGMCGGCRLTVGGETKFACVDGPDFDGHKVDWDLAVKRNQMYAEFEKHKHEETCNLFKKEVQ